ncbi:uncharacterized protein METZ01_LOCUS139425 [marine metagenome]|uniref:Uncharacterized protein n=1 Tax=marine metagenome TaxID=408172 RepID=A0A381ZCA1_9ZZZZ
MALHQINIMDITEEINYLHNPYCHLYIPRLHQTEKKEYYLKRKYLACFVFIVGESTR